MALRSSVQPSSESWALPLLAVVRTPLHSLPWNPCLIMVHIPQPGIEPHKVDEPREPREQVSVVQWNLKSSLPSAAHLGFFLVLLSARAFTASLQSSNRWIVRCVLLTFNILSILQHGLSFLTQLDLKMISTIFRPESSGPSSDTGHMAINWAQCPCKFNVTGRNSYFHDKNQAIKFLSSKDSCVSPVWKRCLELCF